MPALITNKGKEITVNRIKGSGTEPKYVAWGLDGGTALPLDITNTALGQAAPEARTSGTSSVVTTTTTNDTYRVVGTITATATRKIKEVGLFDASTGGNLFVRGTFDEINLEAGDSIQFTINVQFREQT